MTGSIRYLYKTNNELDIKKNFNYVSGSINFFVSEIIKNDSCITYTSLLYFHRIFFFEVNDAEIVHYVLL